MFGDDYQGVPVSGGAFKIANSMILPETESRQVPSSFGGTFLYQLGINGLLAASVGSYLELPDLFNTKTGRSGIGRFGLMDGESIFSWGGVFPPMPSAWERVRPGWVDPITIAHGDSTYRLPAVSFANSADTVYRVLISEREYFLIENRNRDANHDGSTVTMVTGDSTTVRTWLHDSTRFDFTNQRSLSGVITDIDEFDWSLPGFLASDTHVFYDGGILIWHIDENVIDATISTDAVNADPARRGVNLEEADGSQDIGESYGQFTVGSGSESGTPIDYWYSDNPAPLRIISNEFTPTSEPGSLSNAYANSHVYVREFSARGPHMTARIQVGDDVVKMLEGFPKSIVGSVQHRSVRPVTPTSASGNVIVASTSDYTYGWTPDGQGILPSFPPTGILTPPPPSGSTHIERMGTVVAADFNNDQTQDLGVLWR